MNIRSIYRLVLNKLNPLKYAKKAGVNMSGCVFIYGRVVWGTEPWIITLGNNVHITEGVRFLTHDGGTLLFRDKVPDLEITKPITIGDNVYIGNNVLLMPGINIGNNVIIGAGAVVTKDIPDNVIAVGNPCRVLREVGEHDKKYFYKNEEIDWTSVL